MKTYFFSHIKSIFSGILIAVFLTTFFPQSSLAATTTTSAAVPASYERIFYYKDTAAARASLFAHPSAIDVLAPQSYMFDMNGVLQGSIDPSVLAFTKKNNIKVMPLVSNGNFDQVSLTAVLNDPTREQAAITMLVNVAKQNGYAGWQLDFEQIGLPYKDKYSAFVAAAASALHAQNLELSVAVVSKISDNPSDYPKNLWNNLIGAYDYDALSKSADFISVMAYDDPFSRGPIAPYPWLEQVLTYSLQHIPAQKLSLGIPLYYWRWDNTTDRLIEVGTYTGIKNSLLMPGAILGYDPTVQEPFINYVTNNRFYTVWFENAQSIDAKIALINKYNLRGFSAWVLGLETPDIFNIVSR